MCFAHAAAWATYALSGGIISDDIIPYIFHSKRTYVPFLDFFHPKYNRMTRFEKNFKPGHFYFMNILEIYS